MTASSQQIRDFVMPWLDRVALQLEPKVKEAEKKYDDQASRKDLEASKILGLIISASRPPSYHQTGLFNTVTHHHHHTHVVNPSLSKSTRSKTEESESAKSKTDKKEKEVNWKNIVVLTFVCTIVTSVSVFFYTRLSKKEQKANNYLEKTNMVKQFAETSCFTDENTHSLRRVATVQQKIEQNNLDKIKGNKRATLAALTGAITMTAALTAMPWFATASTVVGMAGMTIAAGSAIYATRNLANHWDDGVEAQEGLEEIKKDLTRLRNPNNYIESTSGDYDFCEAQSSYNPYYTEELPPSYAKSQEQYGYGHIASEAAKPTAPIYPKIPEEWKS